MGKLSFKAEFRNKNLCSVIKYAMMNKTDEKN